MGVGNGKSIQSHSHASRLEYLVLTIRDQVYDLHQIHVFIGGQIPQTINLNLWHHQRVASSDGGYVQKSDNPIIFINFMGRYVTVNNFGKNRWFLHTDSVTNIGTARMTNPESRLSVSEIPHFQRGEIRAVEETARQILATGIACFDRNQTYGNDCPLNYYSTDNDALEVEFARTFEQELNATAKLTLAIRIDKDSMVIIVEDSLQQPLLETFVTITKDSALISSYVDNLGTEDAQLTDQLARQFRQKLSGLVEYFEIIL
jgi:hypothetical protein